MLDPLATPQPAGELRGGTVVWLFVGIELLTFGLFFVAFAASRRADPVTFTAGQAELHRMLGAIHTCSLLSGGWLAARGVLANRCDESVGTATFLTGAATTPLTRRRST